MLAIVAISAEGFHIHGHPVTRFNVGNLLPHFLHDTYHLMSDRNSRYGTRNRTMLDMKVACADATQRYSHDGIMRVYQRWLLLFREAKLSLFDICKCFHD